MTDLPAGIRIIWPPPGLESSQGILWKKARMLGLGGALLTLPYLAGMVFPQPFNSLGLFGATWWIRSLAGLMGLLVVTWGMGGLVGFFLRAKAASDQGIDLETILQVGSDSSGDMAALVQGTRSYRSLPEERREQAVQARIWSALLFLCGTVWLSAGWVLSLALAGRGLLGPGGVVAVTLVPATTAFLAGLVAKGVEGTALQGAFGTFLWRRRRDPGVTEAARMWGDGIQELRASRGKRSTSGAGVSLAGALATSALGLLVFLPAAGFTVASSVGPVLASIAIPKFSSTERKAGELEALRHLRLPADPAIGPVEAGEALHALASVDRRSHSSDVVKAPSRNYDQPFLPGEAEELVGIRLHEWPVKLFPAVAEGLPAGGEEFLREVANHPALAEFDRLAAADEMDVLGARLALPLPAEMMSFEIPIPRLSSVREAGYAMVAKAAVEFLDGNVAEAETTLLKALSAGFLMVEEAPTLIDALIGVVLAANAADALEGFYQAAGRDAELDHLRRIREATRRAAEMTQKGSRGMTPASALANMVSRADDEGTLRGLRWEYVHILTGVSPCLNPNRVLFGPDQTYAAFSESARSSLVRYTGEEAVFRTMERGWFTLPARGGVAKALAVGMRVLLGEGPASCTEVLASGIF